METRDVMLSSNDLISRLETFKYSDSNAQVTADKHSDIFKFEIYNKSQVVSYKNDPSEFSFESIAKELLVKENKALKLRCDKLSVQNKSLDQQLDNFRTKYETQEALVKSLQSTNNALKGSDEKSIYLDKRMISLRSDLQLYVDIVNNIQSQSQRPNELEVLFNDNIKNLAVLEDNLLVEKKKTDSLLMAKFLLISDVATLKSTELQLQSKVELQGNRIRDLEITIENLKLKIGYLREEVESERKTAALLQVKLTTTGGAVEAGKEALKLCVAAEEVMKKSFTSEVNSLKATIQSLQTAMAAAPRATGGSLPQSAPVIAPPTIHYGSQQQQQSVPKEAAPILAKANNSMIVRAAGTNRPQNCPACGEIAYGLMVKCHGCNTEHHSMCGRKIKRTQRSAGEGDATGPFMCTACLASTV